MYKKRPCFVWWNDHGKGVLFMRKTTPGEGRGLGRPTALALGSLLALGIELLVLLLGAVAISRGILKGDCAERLSAVACVVGCFLGGMFACRAWSRRRLPVGIGTGALCFALLLLLSLITGTRPVLNGRAAVKLAACLLGGALAGLLAAKSRTKKHHSPSRR